MKFRMLPRFIFSLALVLLNVGHSTAQERTVGHQLAPDRSEISIGVPPAAVAAKPDTGKEETNHFAILTTDPVREDTIEYGQLVMADTGKVIKLTEGNSDNPAMVPGARLKSIYLRIENNQIIKIYVYTNRGLFINRHVIPLIWYNERGPLSCKHQKPRKFDMLRGADLNNSNLCITIGDVLSFEPSLTHINFPGSCEIRLTAQSSAYKLIGAPTADFIINLAVYSDVIGLFGAANGLVQVEGDAEIPINYSNISRKNGYLFRSSKIYLGLSRFDKEFQSIDLRSSFNGQIEDSTASNIFRQAYIRGGVDLNLFSWFTSTNYWNIFGGAEFRQSNLKLRSDETIKANTISALAGINYLSRALDNFRFFFDVRYYILSRVIETPDYAQTDHNWIVSNVGVSYHPPSQPRSRIFLRYVYNHYNNNQGYDFNQIQIGYKTNLGSQIKNRL